MIRETEILTTRTAGRFSGEVAILLYSAVVVVLLSCTNMVQGASVNRAILQHCFFLIRQQCGGCRYGHFTAKFKACDIFLWGYLKSQVFKAPAPRTIQELKPTIQQEVKRIPVEMLQRVIGDVRKRITECLERNGGHLIDVIFGK